MKFSIATPTRNAMPLLRQCVGSVRGQQEVSIEHFIRDAESSDGAGEWLASQRGIRSYVGPDQGMYDAINQAWTESSGDILSWLNADEQYLPGTLARVAGIFELHEEVDFVYGNAIMADMSGNPIAVRKETPLRKFYVANQYLNIFSCTMFFRRRLLEQGILRLNTTYRYAADMDLVLRLLHNEARGLFLRNPCLSLFSITNKNLSLDHGMIRETLAIRNHYGWPGPNSLRSLALIPRVLERVLGGCYRPVSLEYDYALDETPRYRHITAHGVPARFHISHYSRSQRNKT